MRRYRLTSVDKFHGPNAEVHELDLSTFDFNGPRAIGAALRQYRVLMPGQSVAELRADGDSWVVFPRNAPGLTTGYHSIRLEPVGCTHCGNKAHETHWCPNDR